MNQGKKKFFLKTPELDGGNPQFRKFIEENLVYPQQALANRVEGVVHLSYQVNDNGAVFDVQVVKGIGYGCNEEAVRLIKLLNFSSVKNRGVRVKVTKKAKILFKLPVQKIQISYTVSTEENKNRPPENNSEVYSYNISI